MSALSPHSTLAHTSLKRAPCGIYTCGTQGQKIAVTTIQNAVRVVPVDRQVEGERQDQLQLNLEFSGDEMMEPRSVLADNLVRLHGRGDVYDVTSVECSSNGVSSPRQPPHPPASPAPASPPHSWLLPSPPPPSSPPPSPPPLSTGLGMVAVQVAAAVGLLAALVGVAMWRERRQRQDGAHDARAPPKKLRHQPPRLVRVP